MENILTNYKIKGQVLNNDSGGPVLVQMPISSKGLVTGRPKMEEVQMKGPFGLGRID